MRLLRNHRRVLLQATAGALFLAGLALVSFDGRLAVALSAVPTGYRFGIHQAVAACKVLFGFPISPYLYGALTTAAGLALFSRRRRSLIPSALLFVGLSHMTARFVADILKPPFSRLRPFEAIGPDGWHDTWFAAVGNSFPSGHAAHFWSLFFPLIVLFPRRTPAFLILPVLVSAARVTVNDHYLSDVVASIAVAAVITLGYALLILERGVKQLSNIGVHPTAPGEIDARSG